MHTVHVYVRYAYVVLYTHTHKQTERKLEEHK